jgi:AcrR family transcriptional regulator
MTALTTEKVRDADRSRETILDAAEGLFAERGYDGTSMADIAAAAGLSRGAPNYFFGSKDQLYAQVLERVFGGRQAATEAAFGSVRRWCLGDAGREVLHAALVTAAEEYMDFLAARPAFVELVLREELAGGGRLRDATGGSTAMHDAFSELRRVADARGLRPFRVQDAIILFVSLTFLPFALDDTLMRAVGCDITQLRHRIHQTELAVDQLMHLIAGPAPDPEDDPQ